MQRQANWGLALIVLPDFGTLPNCIVGSVEKMARSSEEADAVELTSKGKVAQAAVREKSKPSAASEPSVPKKEVARCLS